MTHTPKKVAKAIRRAAHQLSRVDHTRYHRALSEAVGRQLQAGGSEESALAVVAATKDQLARAEMSAHARYQAFTAIAAMEGTTPEAILRGKPADFAQREIDRRAAVQEADA